MFFIICSSYTLSFVFTIYIAQNYVPNIKKKARILDHLDDSVEMFADRQEEQIVQTSAPTVIDGGVWRSGGTGLRSGLQLAGERRWWLGGSGGTGTLLRTTSQT